MEVETLLTGSTTNQTSPSVEKNQNHNINIINNHKTDVSSSGRSSSGSSNDNGVVMQDYSMEVDETTPNLNQNQMMVDTNEDNNNNNNNLVNGNVLQDVPVGNNNNNNKELFSNNNLEQKQQQQPYRDLNTDSNGGDESSLSHDQTKNPEEKKEAPQEVNNNIVVVDKEPKKEAPNNTSSENLTTTSDLEKEGNQNKETSNTTATKEPTNNAVVNETGKEETDINNVANDNSSSTTIATNTDNTTTSQVNKPAQTYVENNLNNHIEENIVGIKIMEEPAKIKIEGKSGEAPTELKVIFLNLADKEFYLSTEEQALVFCLDDKNRDGSITLQFETSITVLFHASFTCKGETFKPSIFPIQTIQKGNPIRLLIEKPEELLGRGRGSTQTLTLTIYQIDETGVLKSELLSAEFHLRILKTVKHNFTKFSKAKPFERTLTFTGNWVALTEEEKGKIDPTPPSIAPTPSPNPKRRRDSEDQTHKRSQPPRKKIRLDPVLSNRVLDKEINELTIKCDGLKAVTQQLEKTLEVIISVRSHPVIAQGPNSPINYPALLPFLREEYLNNTAGRKDRKTLIFNQGQDVAVVWDPTTPSPFHFRP